MSRVSQLMVLKAAVFLFAISSLLAAFPVSGQGPKCRHRCGGQEIKFPFGVDAGCGADPQHLLVCGDDDKLEVPLVVDESRSLPVEIRYETKTLLINTTVVMNLPNTSCEDFPLPSSAYDVSKYGTVVCQPLPLEPPPLFHVAACQYVRASQIPYAGFTCFNYSRERLGGDDLVQPWIATWLAYASIPWSVSPEKEEQCRGCGRTCGYNTTTLEFVCYPGKKSSNKPAVIGGVVGGGAFMFLVLGGCFIFRRWQAERRRYILGDRSPKPSSNADSLSRSRGSRGGGSRNYYSEHGNSTHFTLRDLQEATNNFSEAGRLGDGGFGTVYKGQLQDSRFVAVKKLNPWNAQGKYQFDNEVTILSQVTHPHLVRLYGCCLEGRELLLVYEYVANGTLADHIHDCRAGFMEWDQRLRIVTQTAEALAFLHNNVIPPIFHRDVKSTNILIDDCFNAKVGDFGLSRLVPSLELTHITTAPQGTPGYLDPDYHQSYQLTDKSDVYSLGVVLMEIVSSQRAVDMSRDRKEINLAALAVAKIACGQMDKLVDTRLGTEFDSVRCRMVEAVAELAFECLAAEKDDRPTMRVVAEKLTEIAAEGRRRYTEEMQREMNSSGKLQQQPSVGNSPTSVQMAWASSNSTSPNNSSSSI